MGAHFHPHSSANPLQVSRASPPIHAISLVDLCFIEPLRRWGRTSGDLLIRASELPRHDEMSTRSQRHHDGSVDATTARDVLTLSRCRSPLSVALTVGATAAGITLASGAATISDRLLSSLRYREIVVSTKVESSAMKLPARQGGEQRGPQQRGGSHHRRSTSGTIGEPGRPIRLHCQPRVLENRRPTVAAPAAPVSGRNGGYPGFLRRPQSHSCCRQPVRRGRTGSPGARHGARLGTGRHPVRRWSALDRTVTVDGPFSGDRRYRIIGVLARSGGDEDM